MTNEEAQETWKRLRRAADSAIRKDHPPAPDEAAQIVDDVLALLQNLFSDVSAIAVALAVRSLP